jgi:hypothetical protein
MRRFLKERRISPAMIIAVVALSLAVAGTGVAATVSALTGGEKRTVKKIAKKQANKRITARAGSLSVNTANFAAQAGGPAAFARLDNPQSATPGIIEADSRGVSDAVFSNSPATGVFCINNFPGLRSASAIGDISNPNNDDTDILVVFTLGDPFGDCVGANGVVYVMDAFNAPSLSDSGFFIQLYT